MITSSPLSLKAVKKSVPAVKDPEEELRVIELRIIPVSGTVALAFLVSRVTLVVVAVDLWVAGSRTLTIRAGPTPNSWNWE